MAYQVIARKWRPQTFDEVTGQEPITRTLRNAIEHHRLHHAYLFSGARGVGKTTSARLLAKALNCHKSTEPTPTPCRSDDPTACPSCREITESRSIDVQEIDAASNTGVDNVREAIIASVGIAPARDRYKIFIIDEVHMLSGAAFNALLKTLEEPPPRVVFIMATTERHKVPETILSRCQQFEFRTIATAKILERLKLIAKAENISIPDDALREIARTGEGSMRDAQSALDQVISFAGTKIKKEDVEMALGVAGADVLTRIIDSIATNKPAVAIGVVDDIVMRGHDLRNFCRDLLAHFRDLLVTKVSGQEELLESAVCDLSELKRQAALFSESDLVRFFHSLSETETKLRAATQPRYQLEVGIVKLMELRGVESISEILQRLQALESGSGSVSSNTPSNPPVRSTPSSFVAAAAVAPALEKTEPESPLEQVKKKLKPMLVTALDSAHVTTWNADGLYIEFAPESRYLFTTLSDPKNTKFLADACREVSGQETSILIEIKEPRVETGAAAKDDEKQRLREMAESSPVVQQALKTFRGEIVDVRRSKTNRKDPN
ncbi:MAG TPA: DNA polymerase III subunit gamma/tau [Pyrinomonadaceae bacterium]|nr:DNA polymerase III subunit gamma/tau [Pyrinomonadaceae bacterium]